jgi:hypothetical protein
MREYKQRGHGFHPNRDHVYYCYFWLMGVRRLLVDSLALGLLLFLVACCPRAAQAQANLPVYTDHLVNAFQDWSWGTHNLTNSTPVHSGANSISVNATAWQAVSFYHPGFDASPYGSLSFWANGGSAAGQVLQVAVHANGADQDPVSVGPLPANTWQQFVIPLTSLHAGDVTNFERFWIQLTTSGAANPFYIDDIQILAKPAPSLVHVAVVSTNAVRIADARWFGANTAVWDSNFDSARTVSLLGELGTRLLRFPGGSLADDYHWASNKTGTNTWTWVTSFANFVHVATNVGVQAIITVNYGAGTPGEAASWVAYANRTNRYGFRYWEIGNECYGTWENDTNVYPHDGYTYAVRAADYLQQMKDADPSIKVGMVVTPGESSSDNGYTNHPAYNPRTGQTSYGWTPVLLTTLKGLGVTPDFLIHHRYPEYTAAGSTDCPDSDPLLLQSSSAWTADAADLRQQIRDYFGPAGTNIELLCTENNSDAGASGRQSTSLVNGLYYADSLGQLMLTEFNGLVWWDLRNGTDTNGTFDPTLYGWRTYRDLGLVNGLGTRHPTFYAAKLMQSFISPGETVLTASSDYLLVSAYAARHANGALSLLVINKDTVTNFNTQIALNGFSPAPSATLRTYGIPQDNAARTGIGSPDIAMTNSTGVASTFSYNLPPLSLTLFTLAPAAPSLAVFLLPAAPLDQFVLQIQGQAGVPYVLQSSTDLSNWSPVVTNVLSSSTLNLTNPAPASTTRSFWRALWQPCPRLILIA